MDPIPGNGGHSNCITVCLDKAAHCQGTGVRHSCWHRRRPRQLAGGILKTDPRIARGLINNQRINTAITIEVAVAHEFGRRFVNE